jgi:hypothetical protein
MHCVLFRDVRRIELLHIQGLRSSQSPQKNGLSTRIHANVTKLLTGLAEHGTYIEIDDSNDEQQPHREFGLGPDYNASQLAALRSFYRKYYSLDIEFRARRNMEYKELSTWFREIAPLDASIIIDISSIKKRYIGDIIAVALVEGITGIYTFEITSTPDFQHPWRMLIHHLTGAHETNTQTQPSYSYINIIDTEIYRQYRRTVLIRAPQLRIALVATFVLLVITGIATFLSSGDSTWIRIFSTMSGTASLAALALVFLPPR